MRRITPYAVVAGVAGAMGLAGLLAWGGASLVPGSSLSSELDSAPTAVSIPKISSNLLGNTEAAKTVGTFMTEFTDSDKEKRLPNYLVFSEAESIGSYADFQEALAVAKEREHAVIALNSRDTPIWSSGLEADSSAFIPDVPLIYQLPELARGCEVTSLAMLLNAMGADADKMTLADQIRKDPTPFEEDEDGWVHFGNPEDGFVGEMADPDYPGFGVYHGPIHDLAEEYFPGRTADLTGSDFNDVLSIVAHGYPVWVIANMIFEPLDDYEFETWEAPDGEVTVTQLEHSVVITGFDESHVYLNDPLEGGVETDRDLFAECWEQMGKQAVTVIKEATKTE